MCPNHGRAGVSARDIDIARSTTVDWSQPPGGPDQGAHECPAADQQAGSLDRVSAAQQRLAGSGAPCASILDDYSLPLASDGHLSGLEAEPLTEHDRRILGVVAQLSGNGKAAALAAWTREGGDALEYAREALEILGEFDRQLLVQVALDALICVHADARGAGGIPAASASATSLTPGMDAR